MLGRGAGSRGSGSAGPSPARTAAWQGWGRSGCPWVGRVRMVTEGVQPGQQVGGVTVADRAVPFDLGPVVGHDHGPRGPVGRG